MNNALCHPDKLFHWLANGVYPAYWGVTNDNEIVSLVIDFFVLLLPDD